jgi:hypothetical protein
MLGYEAKSQWAPTGPPNVIEHQFMNTGGISYFRLVGLLPAGSCCQRIAGYGISRQGSALSQIIEQEIWGGICVDLFCNAWREEWVSVLGALPAGDYSLTLSAGPVPPSIWATVPFTVPINNSPTLKVWTAVNTNTAQLAIQVAGVSNVLYVLESSTDLASWTPQQTNLGAPVTFFASTTNAPNRFYRASIRPAPAHSIF